MGDHSTNLDAHYEHVAGRFVTTSTGDYAQLVTPNGNASEPVHRWFHLKEAFSHRLLARVLKDVGLDGQNVIRIVDPFAGSGTTFVSAGQLVQEGSLDRAFVLGIETNPYLHLLASSKLRSFQDMTENFLVKAGAVVATASKTDAIAARPPALSTFNERYFPEGSLGALMRLKAGVEAGADDTLTSDLLRLCLAGAVEPASRLRKDGRALRMVPGREPIHPYQAFLDVASAIAEDLPIRRTPIAGRVEFGDVRRWSLPKQWRGSADLAVFSPPYPNNIDYTEVYKLEAWLLGFINSQEEFSQQRLRTLRSHGSLNWADRYAFEKTEHAPVIRELLAPVLESVPPDRYAHKRRQLVLGYADDMSSCLELVARALRPGGQAACVVGNSLHGHGDRSLLLASDVLIAAIAELYGLRVRQIEVARVPSRRRTSSPFLRESVVFMERPN